MLPFDPTTALLNPRAGNCFSDLHVAPRAGIYRSVQNSSNEHELPIPFLLVDSAPRQPIAFPLMGLFD